MEQDKPKTAPEGRPQPPSERDRREARLAQALRDNLRRRKGGGAKPAASADSAEGAE